jgi:hypothetical protein
MDFPRNAALLSICPELFILCSPEPGEVWFDKGVGKDRVATGEMPSVV